jgi:hypothetical protein
MASSRSRLRTVGAFGNPKPRPIGFVPKPALPSDKGPRFRIRHDEDLGNKWKAYTIATGLLNGLLGQKPVGQKAVHEHQQAIIGATNISQMMWNAAIQGAEGEEKAFKAISELRHPVTKENVAPPTDECRKLIRDLVDLKKRLYPDEKREIVEYERSFDPDGTFHFRVNGLNMKPEGLVKPEGTVI